MLTKTEDIALYEPAADLYQPLPHGTDVEDACVASNKSGGMTAQTEWMLAVRNAQDRAAFGRLFEHFAPRVKGMLMRQGHSAAMAEDIVQDVMLTVWHRAHQFDPARAQVSAWVFQIARNRRVDVLRKEQRPIPEELAEPEGQDPDQGQALEMAQEAERLKTALDTLSDDQRDVVERAYLGDLSHSDIRDVTGLPLGTIKSRIRLGLERLRHELKELR